MGLLDSVLGNKEKPAKEGLGFNFSTALRPVRLAARKDNCLELLVTVKNVTELPAMISVAAEVPKVLGFESIGIAKIKEIRIGELPPQQEKTVNFTICASARTPAGVYSALLTVNHHYRDYSHIQNYAKKTVEIRVV